MVNIIGTTAPNNAKPEKKPVPTITKLTITGNHSPAVQM